jgi:hypothetical protein
MRSSDCGSCPSDHWRRADRVTTVIHRCRLVAVAGLLCGAQVVAAFADEPLHVRIDRLIVAPLQGIEPRPTCDDHAFARRLYLDLAGRIPSRDELAEFVADASEDKRPALIERLLGGPDYPRRMQELFHAMLMERRGDQPDWTTFLRTSFAVNRPWNELVGAITHPDADSEQDRGAAFFFTRRLVSEGAMAPVDVPGLTRDFGRLFAGVDLQCAQCHDHLTVEQYKQRDFQGLHAVFTNVVNVNGKPFPAVAEKVMTAKTEFMSVFTQEPMSTGPRVPGGDEIEIAVFDEGQEFAVEPDNKARTTGVPKFSPLKELAQRLTSAENALFCRNIANRLWFVMMGRGLVEPLDLLHDDNPPSHPELLDLLATEFAARQFDVKWLLREMALSETYQRSSTIPAVDALPDISTHAIALEKRLSAEQLFWSTLVALGEVERLRAVEAEKPDDKADDKAEAKAEDKAASPQLWTKTPLEDLVTRHEHLQKLQKSFVDAFANPPQEPEIEFEPSVKAVLFLLNDNRVLQLFERRPGNLIDSLARSTDDAELVDGLFLSILSRPPTDDDRRDVHAYLLSRQDDRDAALGHLAAVLLSSTEFCINH